MHACRVLNNIITSSRLQVVPQNLAVSPMALIPLIYSKSLCQKNDPSNNPSTVIMRALCSDSVFDSIVIIWEVFRAERAEDRAFEARWETFHLLTLSGNHAETRLGMHVDSRTTRSAYRWRHCRALGTASVWPMLPRNRSNCIISNRFDPKIRARRWIDQPCNTIYTKKGVII